ncbi:MAG: beta-N-acetylhexosaminidase [Lachnospiraceae bacterium]|nr:beta-N-acetylhexosaminidase [Lachnospiraceae bacterium]
MEFGKFEVSDEILWVLNELEKEISHKSKSSKICLKAECDEKIAGYSIEKTGDTVLVKYKSLPQFGRAIFLLAGTKQCDGKIEAGSCFEDFGIMLDVSRNAVHNLDTLKKYVRILSLFGYGFLGLYMEDTLKIDNEPYWGYMRGAYTKEEIKELDEYAAKFGIELRPFIQTLAHVNQVVRYAEYDKVVDTADILLPGDPRTEEIIDHILKTVSETFTTRKVNIGMDEAYLVGRGKYIEKNGYKPRKEVMQKHLDTVLSLCRKYGIKPQMWSDMFFDFNAPHSETKKNETYKVPDDLEICYWDYYYTNEEHYDAGFKSHFLISDNVAFAGGAWKWSGIAPFNMFSTRTNLAAVASSKRNNVKSYTVTCWGDDGAECSCFAILPVLFNTANMVYEDAMKVESFKRLTGISLDEFLDVDHGNAHMSDNGKFNNSGKLMLYNDPLIGTFDSVIKEDTEESFAEANEKLKLRADDCNNKYAYIFKTLECYTRVLKDKTNLGKNIQKAYKDGDKESLKQIANGTIPEIITALDEYYKCHKKQWETENKANGFEIQTIRIGGLKQRLQDVKEKIEAYLDGSAKEIPFMDEAELPYAYSEESDLATLNYNIWRNIVSPSVMGF